MAKEYPDDATSAAIIGCGPVGLMAILAAQAQGAEKVRAHLSVCTTHSVSLSVTRSPTRSLARSLTHSLTYLTSVLVRIRSQPRSDQMKSADSKLVCVIACLCARHLGLLAVRAAWSQRADQVIVCVALWLYDCMS